MKSMKHFLLLAVMTMLLVVVTACGGASTTEPANEGENEQTENTNEDNSTENIVLEGSVEIDGSGTVYPLMARLAEDYMINEQEDVSVEVSRAGTSAGFKKFLVPNGTDFNNASRHIKEEEEQEAAGNNIEVQEFKVALDGLTFVINKENDWATELTEQEVIDIFLNSKGLKKWSDVRPEFPDEEIKTYGPNENHGTYEFFFENILKKEDLVQGINLQQEYSTLVNLVANDKNAIGFFGFGYYVNNQDQLQAVQVDFGNGPVAPSLETIKEDGAYAPFTRPVFTYLNVGNAKEKPQVLDFAIYAMKHAPIVAGEVGFAPLPEADVQQSISILEGLK